MMRTVDDEVAISVSAWNSSASRKPTDLPRRTARAFAWLAAPLVLTPLVLPWPYAAAGAFVGAGALAGRLRSRPARALGTAAVLLGAGDPRPLVDGGLPGAVGRPALVDAVGGARRDHRGGQRSSG